MITSKINIQLSPIDIDNILTALNEKKNNSLKSEWISISYNDDRGYWEKFETKESRSIQSTINYIVRQVNENT